MSITQRTIVEAGSAPSPRTRRSAERPAGKPVDIGGSDLDDRPGGTTPGDSGGQGGLFRPIAKYRYRCLIAFALGLTLTMVWVAGYRTAFVSEATIFVRQSLAEVLSEDPSSPSSSRSLTESRDYVNVQVSLLTSQDLRRALLDTLMERGVFPSTLSAVDPGTLATTLGKVRDLARGLMGDAEPDGREPSRDEFHDAMLRGIEANLTIVNLPTSSLIQIRYSHIDPVIARSVVETALEVYDGLRREMYSLGPILTGLESALDKAQADLGAAMDNLDTFSGTQNIFDLPTQRTTLDSNLADLIRTRQAAEIELNEVSARLRQVAIALEGLEPEIEGVGTASSNPRWTYLMQRKDELTLLLLASDLSPEIKRIKSQLDYINKALDSTPEHLSSSTAPVVNTAYLHLKNQVDVTAAEVDGKEAAIADLTTRIEALNAESTRLMSLQAEYDQHVRAIDRARSRAEEREASVQSLRKQAEFVDARILGSQRIVEQPTLGQPAGGGRKKPLLMGLGLSMMVAFGIGMLSGLLDRTVKSPTQLRSMAPGVTTAAFPDVARRRDRKRFARIYGPCSPTLGGAKIVDLAQGSMAVMIDRVLSSTGIMGTPQHSSAQFPLVVCGIRAGDGATTLAINLASRLCRLGRRVLVIAAADRVHSDTGRAPAGLEDHLSNIDRVLLPEEEFLLASSAQDPIQALSKDSGTYDAIVVDAPPLTSGATLHLLRPGTSVVLVTCADQTRTGAVRHAIDLLQDTPARLSAIIINRQHYYLPTWIDPLA